jgi:hypothetical protein
VANESVRAAHALVWFGIFPHRSVIMLPMDTTTTPLEPGNRIELPAEWAEALGLGGLVTLERTDNGILIRPCPRFTWDDFFATRLSVRPGDAATAPEVTEVSGDDLLF